MPAARAVHAAPRRQELVHLHELLEAWVGATLPQGSPQALPAHLERLLAPDYEHISAEGAVVGRAQRLEFWRETRRGGVELRGCGGPAGWVGRGVWQIFC